MQDRFQWPPITSYSCNLHYCSFLLRQGGHTGYQGYSWGPVGVGQGAWMGGSDLKRKLFCAETIFGRSWVTIVHHNFKKRLKMSKNRVQKWKNARRSHSFIYRKLKICQKNIWVQNPALGQIWPESINATHFMGQRSKNLFCWLWGPRMLFPKFSKWQMKIWLKAKILTY